MTESLLSGDERSRYSRHILLPEIGLAGQKMLRQSSVLCVGAGGLGSPILLYLAAAGVGRIVVIDFDVVDASNLQRQVVHGSGTIGQLKTESAQARLKDLNPFVVVETVAAPLSSTNALQLIEAVDVVIDGSDNFPARYLINDACVILGKPFVYGAIFKFEGQVSVFNHRGGWHRPAEWETLSAERQQTLRLAGLDWEYDEHTQGPTYRDLFPQPPPPGQIPSCSEAGVLGVLPAVVGSLQATECLKILLGIGRTLSGRLLVYDALALSFRELKLQRDASSPEITQLVDYDVFCGVDQRGLSDSFDRITAQELGHRLDHGWDPVIVDVRGPDERKIVRMAVAKYTCLPEQIADFAADFHFDTEIVIHCKSGGRSAIACQKLVERGFTNVFNLEGGILEWIAEVEPTLPIY